jgi:integrase
MHQEVTMGYIKKRWAGGRVYVADDGSRTYHIYKMRNGRRYSVSTRCSEENAALKEYQRWQQDPEAYRPLGGEERLVIDDTLIDLYVKDCEERQLSEGRIARCRSYLRWWGERIPALDRATLRDLDRAAEGAKNRGMRINVLKAFCSWLVRTGRLDPAKNASVHLQVPSPTPAQVTRSRVIDEEDHEAVLRKLPREYADLATIMRATGCHVTELERFVESGSTDVLDKSPANRHHWAAGTPYILVFPHHKSKGAPLRIAVDGDAWRAARAARKRGTFNRVLFYRAFRKACIDARIEEPFTPGDYRATLATELVEAGADIGSVAMFLGHRSVQTTRKFYATMATIPNPKITIKPS